LSSVDFGVAVSRAGKAPCLAFLKSALRAAMVLALSRLPIGQFIQSHAELHPTHSRQSSQWRLDEIDLLLIIVYCFSGNLDLFLISVAVEHQMIYSSGNAPHRSIRDNRRTTFSFPLATGIRKDICSRVA
jgi:hypothetical protein